MFQVLALIAVFLALLSIFMPFGKVVFLFLAVFVAMAAYLALLSYGFGWPPPPPRRRDD